MTLQVYESVPIHENNEPLVNLHDYPFAVESAYFKQGIAPDNSVLARKGVTDKLLAAQEEFSGKYRFKIWDAYRPRSVQDAIYKDYWQDVTSKNPDWSEEQIKNEVEKFVTKATEQKRIPPHATGGAVDLTLVDADDKELDMGTEFDYFGPEAASLYYENAGMDNSIRENRKLLRTAMAGQGFRIDDDEWWHFDYGNQIWAMNTNQPYAIYGEVKV